MTTVEVEKTALDEFMERVASKLKDFNTIVKWHTELHAATGVDLPWSVDDTYVSVNQYKKDENGKVINYNDEGIDIPATIEVLKRIARFASKYGVAKIEKDYGYDFKLEITLEENNYRTLISYRANREAVCTKKVVDRKFIPAKMTPARYEDVVEWDCEKVSLLS